MLEVTFTPADFTALRQRDLSQTVCVVFDVLRATSSMVTALANGAREIIPVCEIAEAVALRAARPDLLLAGERDGVRILRALTGSVDFDLGNSPREFTRQRVGGRSIAMTTTNGTRALQACRGAQRVLVGSFLNLGAVADWIARERVENLLVVCSGTLEEASYEDVLGAGALCDAVWAQFAGGKVADSAQVAREIYRLGCGDLLAAVQRARNARRLLALPKLRDDVPLCLQRDTANVLAELTREGAVVRLGLR
ncbi:MAG: 2-phosphosulfolactate phosphatase [Pedosphaera sp. Tous-C6FEB]|nr:MAG: 2-phosphosulfolactate phosphatase [Pedosphaera sp. Tous-C6FEB]